AELARKALDDGAAEVRTLAVEAIAKAPADVAAPLLAKAAKDPSPAVADVAIEKLKKVKHPLAYQALAEVAIDGQGLVRDKATEAFINIKPRSELAKIPSKTIERGLLAQDELVRKRFVQVTEEYLDAGGRLSPAALASAVLLMHEAVEALVK